jgi:hypothetical protein
MNKTFIDTTSEALLALDFSDRDARMLTVLIDTPQALAAAKETLSLCKMAALTSGRTVSPLWGGTPQGLAAAFLTRATPAHVVRATLRESLTLPLPVDVWALRRQQLDEAAR